MKGNAKAETLLCLLILSLTSTTVLYVSNGTVIIFPSTLFQPLQMNTRWRNKTAPNKVSWNKNPDKTQSLNTNLPPQALKNARANSPSPQGKIARSWTIKPIKCKRMQNDSKINSISTSSKLFDALSVHKTDQNAFGFWGSNHFFKGGGPEESL